MFHNFGPKNIDTDPLYRVQSTELSACVSRVSWRTNSSDQWAFCSCRFFWLLLFLIILIALHIERNRGWSSTRKRRRLLIERDQWNLAELLFIEQWCGRKCNVLSLFSAIFNVFSYVSCLMFKKNAGGRQNYA